jgi:hypothetical protein
MGAVVADTAEADTEDDAAVAFLAFARSASNAAATPLGDIVVV